MRNLTILLFILVFQIFGNNNQIYQKNMSGVAVVLSDQGSGSGVILCRSGYVLTNYHVEEKQKQLEKFIMNADVIQTQTPINGGNSGGPLLNQSGNLIGIATFGTPENEGLNFAISVEEIIRFLKY